jgi:hypothetical protein
MLYPVRAINTNMLQVKGKSDRLLILEIIKKAIAVLPLLIGVYVSIYWMLWSAVLTGIIGYILNASFSGREIKYSVWQQFIDILPSFLFGVVVAGGIYGCTFLGFSYFASLMVQIAVGFTIILVLGEITKLEPYIELKSMIVSMLNKGRRTKI